MRLPAITLAALLLHAPALACGSGTDCTVDGGTYRIVQPDSDTPTPALIFLHGWKGTSQGVIGNKKLRKHLDDLGFALVVPQGAGRTWSYPGSPSQHRDEFAFFDALRTDLIDNHNIDPDKITVSGFSMGGSMVWNLACQRGSDYAAFLPFAGAFWNPLPQSCPDPTDILLHTHGTSDTVVPIAGRAIGDSFRQGDAWKSFAVMRAASPQPLSKTICDALTTCTRWSDADTRFEFREHPGGHRWSADWLAGMLRELTPRPLR